MKLPDVSLPTHCTPRDELFALMRERKQADAAAADRMIDDRTTLVVGSAPNYPHGVVDPIPELAGLAGERGVPFHTDAAVGGFLLPFMERAGYDVPPPPARCESEV
ncbi:MAG: hypothetical protein ACRDKJ_05765 [Actinomycetota bacterium]